MNKGKPSLHLASCKTLSWEQVDSSMRMVISKAVKDQEAEKPGRTNCPKHRILREWQRETTMLSIFKARLRLSVRELLTRCVSLGKRVATVCLSFLSCKVGLILEHTFLSCHED